VVYLILLIFYILYRELVGKIGELDISDCYTAAEAVKQMTLDTVTIDTEKVFYNGGSHGGFIGAHMISKYPVIILKYYYYYDVLLLNVTININLLLIISFFSYKKMIIFYIYIKYIIFNII